ncbi:MAG: hypothetical protein KIS86_06280 [Devosia sp.]|nr:hypothetical protein [Devosia sp.]
MSLKVNDYRMYGDFLVRISDNIDGFRYGAETIKVIEENGVLKVESGEQTFMDFEHAFTRITDTRLVAAARVYEANRQYEEIDKKVDDAWQTVMHWNDVLQCAHEAERARASA